MRIVVIYESIDGVYKPEIFDNLPEAQRFAHDWIGEHPDMGGYYAVSFDGVGKITVDGDATLRELFPSK